jgi:LmbE family N-acetylglucosaminyl deacetylase
LREHWCVPEASTPKTLVLFHAHPDDECISTGGVIAHAAAAGHRVVVVFATRGELGEVLPGVLAPGESLAERRVAEAQRAAGILGAQRVEFLGYRDSGMEGVPENDSPGSFWRVDVEEAAARLAKILDEEHADVLTVYDSHGGYDHPDHVQVHRVGVRAGELAATDRVYEATINRDAIRNFMIEHRDEAQAAGVEPPEGVQNPDEIMLGVPEAEITTFVDVGDFVETKRAALAAHASQVDETTFFLAMPIEMFRLAFGTEYFIRRGAPPDTHETSLFADTTGS